MRSQDPNPSNETNRKNGFTLIEVLIAIVILSVGLLGMASLTVGIIKGNKLSNDQTTATTLAQDKMEEIRSNSYASVASETKAACATPYNQFQREVTVVTDSPGSGMKTVTVKVYWGPSDAHHVELKTILCQ